MSRKGARHVESAVQVDVHDALPGVQRQFGDRDAVAAARSTGVVDQKVHPPEMGHHLRHQCIDRLGVGHAGDNRQGTPAQCTNFVCHRCNVAPAGVLLVLRTGIGRAACAGQHHVTAGSRQRQCNRPSNAAHAASARDHCHLAVKSCQCESHAASLGLGWLTLVAVGSDCR